MTAVSNVNVKVKERDDAVARADAANRLVALVEAKLKDLSEGVPSEPVPSLTADEKKSSDLNDLSKLKQDMKADEGDNEAFEAYKLTVNNTKK